jgi:hypothetical protein
LGEASRGEPASRSASELEAASLHQAKVASLSEMMKPATDDEATGECSRRAFRGERRQRVGTERSRNLGDPAQVDEKCVRRRAGMHNCASGCGRESDRLIVARKRVTTVERRGRSHCVQMSEEG